MRLAHAYERRGEEDLADSLAPLRGTTTPRFSAPIPTNKGKLVTVCPAASPPVARTASPTPASVPHRGLLPRPPTSRFRCLTPKEMDDRRLKGLYYNCPMKFTRDHACSFKGIYLLKLDED